jgi:hypothetical protein
MQNRFLDAEAGTHCGSFVTAVGGADGSPSSPISDSQPPLLTHPQA